jgi:hypothetical protein
MTKCRSARARLVHAKCFKPFSVVENRIDIRIDRKFAQQSSAGSRVLNGILDERAAIVSLETMLMNPQTVWPATLNVDETIWGLPLRNLALPAKQYARAHLKCSALHFDAGFRILNFSHGGAMRSEAELERELRGMGK